MLSIAALGRFFFLTWTVSFTAAFLNCGHVRVSAGSRVPTSRLSPLPMHDIPSLLLAEASTAQDSVIPVVIYTFAAFLSAQGLARQAYQQLTETQFSRADPWDPKSTRPLASGSAPGVDELFLPKERTKQEKLDLLAKAEYYEREAIRSKPVARGRKRSIIGRVLKPWGK